MHQTTERYQDDECLLATANDVSRLVGADRHHFL